MTVQVEAKQQLRDDFQQAIASAQIEGFKPGAEFLADVEAVIEGTMTDEELRAASLARALAADREAAKRAAAHDA